MTYGPDPLLRAGRSTAVNMALGQHALMKTLESGVTTVRDMNAAEYADVSMRDLVNMGHWIGPRMFVVGCGLRATRSRFDPLGPHLTCGEGNGASEFARAERFRYSAGAEARLKDFIERNVETTRKAVAAGAMVAMGSDAIFSMFGQNTRELGWFVKAGMTPAQALASATTTAAKMMGMETSIGTVAPGFLADIVAVEGDPLADVNLLIENVRWVMKDGVVVGKTGRSPR